MGGLVRGDMHIFIAGATGAVGRTLIPTLVAEGHTVTGTTRTEAKADALRALGARAVVMDGLDHESVMAAVTAAEPDAIVHQMSALAGDIDLRNPDKTFAMTNRLRTEGTEHLLAAAEAAGVRRLVAQSYAGWPYGRAGGPAKTEADPLDPDPPRGLRETLAAIRRLEALVTGAGGVILRYGGFYGPGTGLAPGGAQLEMIRARKFPLIGDGGGIWSFAHTEDVATGTVAALERGRDGEIYNICDDEPAPVRVWLPAIARSLGAKPPRRVPAWVARIVSTPGAVALMTDVAGASNAKAKAELDWTPAWPSWREGFAALSAAAPTRPRSREAGSAAPSR
jgi:nucleoside-diphosphate-sugar epimerase